MLAFLKANPSCRTMLVEKTDRLYRNIRDWITVDDRDLAVHFVKENAVVSKASRSSEKFNRQTLPRGGWPHDRQHPLLAARVRREWDAGCPLGSHLGHFSPRKCHSLLTHALLDLPARVGRRVRSRPTGGIKYVCRTLLSQESMELRSS